MKDPLKIKDLIIEKLDLALVLKQYGAQFVYSPDHVDEAQYRCPIHGRDNKPSARYYKNTKSCFCWVCRKKWDVISLIEEKENLNFMQALRFIVDRYKIDISSIPDDDPGISKKTRIGSEEKSDLIKLKGNILEQKRKLPLEKYKAFCYAYYMILYENSKGEDISESIKKLGDKIESFNKG